MYNFNTIIEEYFVWLCHRIELDTMYVEFGKTYECLMDDLYSRRFYWSVEHDENRSTDGIDLRNKFADEFGYSRGFWLDILPDYCTVFEMLIALAIRCEENIMHDDDYGDRTYKWFWEMLHNLGVLLYDDENYDKRKVNEIIDIFLNREYQEDGRGNIFVAQHLTRGDTPLAHFDLWYQANFYFEENYW